MRFIGGTQHLTGLIMMIVLDDEADADCVSVNDEDSVCGDNRERK